MVAFVVISNLGLLFSMAKPMAAKAKAADKPKAKGNKDKWPQLLRGYEDFSCREVERTRVYVRSEHRRKGG